jgi:apolipoprotein N-acyltransferase
VLLGVAFLPVPLGFLAWVACVPLLMALDARVRAGAQGASLFRLGYAFGFAFYLIGMHWIALLSDVAITVPWLKYPAWIAAAAYLALFGGLATWLAGTLARRAGVPLAVAFPPAFLLVEELRASGEMGFPWFQPGYTQQAYVSIVQLASLGSVTLVTLWVLVLNVLAWRALTSGRKLAFALAAVAWLVAPWAWGTAVLARDPGPAGPVVALIQGDVAGEIKWSGKHQGEILDGFLRLSEDAARGTPRPILAIWPETATGSYLRKQLEQTLRVAGFAARTSLPVFSGYADYRFDARGRPLYQNGAGLFAPDGTLGESYAKRHLVPFGERMPFQRLVPALGRIELGQAEWTPGDRTVLFPSAAGPFACLICFEAIFPDLARRDVRKGARWLVNITNDEWFGNSAALYQHAAMAVFRAAENHVPVARCANTGLTLMADATGRVTARLPVFTAAVLAVPLPAPASPTPFTALGDWPGLLCVACVVALGVRALMPPRGQR